jgi:hypothetical protein
MPRRFCQCRGCTACNTQAGSHGTLFDADATRTLKCPPCQAVATRKRNARAPRAARGYGKRHDQVRKMYEPVIAAGNGWCAETSCLMPTRYISPGEPWDLAHNEDRTGYKGPAHRRCNRATNKG